MRNRGKVKWFSDEKGYGFIATDSGRDIFVHYSHVAGSGGRRKLEKGQLVEFDISSSPKGQHADNVTVLA